MGDVAWRLRKELKTEFGVRTGRGIDSVWSMESGVREVGAGLGMWRGRSGMRSNLLWCGGQPGGAGADLSWEGGGR